MCVASLVAARREYAIQLAMPPSPDDDGSDSDDEPAGSVAPAMPVIVRPLGWKAKHRPKIPHTNLPFAACVARPVSKSEIALKPAAQAAMDLEFNKLRDRQHPGLKTKGCWDEGAVQEFKVVKARGQKPGAYPFWAHLWHLRREG